MIPLAMLYNKMLLKAVKRLLHIQKRKKGYVKNMHKMIDKIVPKCVMYWTLSKMRNVY